MGDRQLLNHPLHIGDPVVPLPHTENDPVRPMSLVEGLGVLLKGRADDEKRLGINQMAFH